jgi:glycosyltransferase involved in cell wall biosynthesis
MGEQDFLIGLSVVMPAYNEEATLRDSVEAVLTRVPSLGELIIVDDGSQDSTGVIADQLAKQDPRVVVKHHRVNQGKTAALKTAFAVSRGAIVIVQDADLEYDPAEIAGVIEPITLNHADVVYGSRFMVRRASRAHFFYHFLANKALTFMSNMFTNIHMTDVETCYKAFRGEIIRNMIITSTGFGFEIEVSAKVAKLKCRIYEVPISYYGRSYAEGKKIGFRDGVAAGWYIFRYNLFCSLKSSYREVPELGCYQHHLHPTSSTGEQALAGKAQRPI